MQDLRTKRIRLGVILILASVVAMLVLAGFSHDTQAYGYRLTPDRRSWIDKIGDRSITLWKTGEEKTGSGFTFGRPTTTYTYAKLPYSAVFAIGMAVVGLGAVLIVIGLTTPRGELYEGRYRIGSAKDIGEERHNG